MEAPDSLLDRSPIFIAIFLFICVNGFIFFFLVIFFDGGAFPWGEIRGDRYFVITNSGETEISRRWFYVSFWHGAITWASAGICILIVWMESFISSCRRRKWAEALGRLGGSLFIAAWLAFMVFETIAIAA